MKRLIIYFHYDAKGQVDETCRFAVRALLPFGNLIFVTNGTLRQADREWIQANGLQSVERENVGLDVGAYRQILLSLGEQNLRNYDELILMNYTLAGPVFSLQSMFDAMEARKDLDFWGLTRHYAMRSRRFGGWVPEHLQSHFLAIRSNMFLHESFWQYWQQMQLPRSYEESVARHETRFTEYFLAQGFRWDSYVSTEDLSAAFVNPIMACPQELVAHRGCPFFKRRSLFTSYADELRRTDGTATRALVAYLQKETTYPLDDLIESLLYSQPLAALAENMPWQYVVEALPESFQINLEQEGLQLLRFAPMKVDAVTQWYFQQSVDMTDGLAASLVTLFRQNPRMGVVCPALPAWSEAENAWHAQWKAVAPNLVDKSPVAISATPPPAPLAGWAIVRKAALVPEQSALQHLPEFWRLPLTAQANGYYTATFETPAQASARMAQLSIYMRAGQTPAVLAKQLGRLAKHRLQRRTEGEKNH